MLQIVIQRVVTMFIIVIVGFAAGKANILTAEHNRGLSGILINVCLPCMVINSFQQELSSDKVIGILLTLAVAVVMYSVLIFGSMAFFKKGRTHEYGISRHAAIYGNAGFMGIPIIEPLLGNIGVLYATVHICIINSFGFIQGDQLISGSRKINARQIINMPIIGVLIGLLLFLLQISLPNLILVPVKTIGNMVTPMSMLMTGVSLSTIDTHHLEHIRDVIKVSLFRMVISPLVIIMIIGFLPIDPVVKLVTIIVSACPALSFTLVLSIRHQKDSLYASEIISLTTLVFMGTMPLLMMLCNAIGLTV